MDQNMAPLLTWEGRFVRAPYSKPTMRKLGEPSPLYYITLFAAPEMLTQPPYVTVLTKG